MSIAIWAALGFLCFAFGAGVAWVGYQLIQAWRLLRRLPGGILGQVAELNRGLQELERRVSTVERQVTDLQENVRRVSVSLARARVLMGAVGEVRSAIASAKSLIPTK